MKKFLAGMLSLTLLAAMALPALASGDNAPAAAEETAPTGYAVEIDGGDSGIRAQVVVPLRAVAEKLGFTVAWDNGVVTVTGPERYAQLTVGVDQYFAAPTQEGMAGASLSPWAALPMCSTTPPMCPWSCLTPCWAVRRGLLPWRGTSFISIPIPAL